MRMRDRIIEAQQGIKGTIVNTSKNTWSFIQIIIVERVIA